MGREDLYLFELIVDTAQRWTFVGTVMNFQVASPFKNMQ
jgi:hypothetical protein